VGRSCFLSGEAGRNKPEKRAPAPLRLAAALNSFIAAGSNSLSAGGWRGFFNIYFLLIPFSNLAVENVK